MSSRRPLRSHPLPSLSLRLFVVLMAVLQFVAPTWHICSLGGHALSMSSGGRASHHGEAAAAEPDSNAPQQPLICYCPPKREHSQETAGPKLTATANHGDHATCLALLLQTMPGALADPIALARVGTPVVFRWQPRSETSPSVAFFGRFRGRAPPLNC